MKNDTNFLRESQMAYSELRRQDQIKKFNIKNALYEQKHSDMLQIRRQRKLNEASKKEFEDKIKQEKRHKSQNVKEQEAMSKMRVMQYYENKLKQFRQNHELETSWQEALKRKREAEVYTLEKMELEMLAKLQLTQNIEKAAYEQLEEAINVPTSEFKTKYNSDFMNTTKDKKMFNLTKRTSSPMVPSPLDSRSFFVMRKRDFDESIPNNDRQNQTQLFGRSNLKNSGQWAITRDEKVKREQRIYGKKSTGQMKILEKIVTPKKSNLNKTIVYEKGEAKGGETDRRRNKNIDQMTPLNRNRSLGGNFDRSDSKNGYKTIGDYLGVKNEINNKSENEELTKLLKSNKEHTEENQNRKKE